MSRATSQIPASRRAPIVLGLTLLIGLVAAALAATSTGATAPLVFVADAGPLVRWSALFLRVIRDLAAALTVGALLLSGAMIPIARGDEAASRARRDTAFRVAGRTAYVWAAAGVAGVLLAFADAAGMRLTDPALGGELLRTAWSLDTTRIGVISAGCALLVASAVALVTPTAKSALWLAALAVAGVGILGLASHTGASADHETSVNAMGVHLVGAVVWVGGLAALVVLRPGLGGTLTTVVRRFSSVALWAFIAVGASGVLAATTRLATWADLRTPYGLLVVVKALAFVALGAAGWWHRRSTIAALDGSPSGGAFSRLVSGEVVLMGFTFGIATALARSAPPEPQDVHDPSPALALTGFPAPAAPGDLAWLGEWRVDWLFLSVGLVAIGLYAAGLVALGRSGRAWPARRTLAWVVGWVVFLLATSGPLGVYGRVAFSWHVGLVLVETLVVPVLLVLGAPLRLALATLAARDDGTIGPREVVEGLVSSRAFAVVGNPVVAAALLVLSLGALVGTGLLELALTTHSGHVVATAWFMVVGSAFAWSVVRPGPARPRGVRALSSPHDSDRSDEDAGDGPRLVVLLAVTALHVAAGLALSRSTQLLAPDFFKELHLPWVTDLLADQQRGGALYGLLAVLASVTLVMVVLAGERSARRSGPDAPDTPPSGTHRD